MEDNSMFWFIATVGLIVSAIVAASKNRNVIGYAALGFFLPIIGMVAICCLPALKPENEEAV